MDASLEISLASAASAVKYEGHAVCFVNLDESLDVELRGVNIVSMQVSDSNGKCIDACLLDKLNRFLNIGKDIGSIHARVSYFTQFGFNVHTGCFGDSRHFARNGDILLERQRGTVEHDRSEAQTNGADTSFKALPVVQMHANGHRRPFSCLEIKWRHQFHRRFRELNLSELQDDWGA